MIHGTEWDSRIVWADNIRGREKKERSARARTNYKLPAAVRYRQKWLRESNCLLSWSPRVSRIVLCSKEFQIAQLAVRRWRIVEMVYFPVEYVIFFIFSFFFFIIWIILCGVRGRGTSYVITHILAYIRNFSKLCQLARIMYCFCTSLVKINTVKDSVKNFLCKVNMCLFFWTHN